MIVAIGLGGVGSRFAGAQGAPPPWTPGRVIVRLDPAQVPTCAHCLFASGIPIGAGIDEANAAVGARGVQPVHDAQHGEDDGWPVTVADMHARFLAGIDRAHQLNPARRDREVKANTSALVEELLSTYVVTLDPGTDPESAAALYRQQPGVLWAAPNYNVHLTAFDPTDEYWTRSNSWFQGNYPDLWGLVQIGAHDAWQVSRGAGIRIAVLDTGQERLHPDLGPNFCLNPDDPVDGVDNDGNGYKDDTYCGYNFAQKALGGPSGCPPLPGGHDYANPCDHDNHGSHVAGIAAAVANNGGVIGVAPEARIMPLKVFAGGGQDKKAPISGIYAAMLYATLMGADVVNVSWSCDRADCGLLPYFQLAYLFGVVSVVASDNDRAPISTQPANIETAVLTVGASDRFGNRADFSNFGPQLDLVAPGGGSLQTCNCGGQTDQCTDTTKNILSARSFLFDPHDTFGCYKTNDLVPFNGNWSLDVGTSMAAPHVAGAAADLLGRFPWMTPLDVGFVLERSAVDVASTGVGWDPFTGYGRLQANRALGSTLPVRPVEDTWVDSGQPGVGHGSDIRLKVDGSGPRRIIYLKFDLRGVSGHQGAALRVCTGPNAASGGGGHVYRVDPNAWTEAGTTWNNRPTLGEEIATIQEPILQSMPSDTCVTIDVTPYVHPLQINSFAIAKDTTAADGLAYVSREGDAGPKAPQLLLSICGGCNPCNGATVMTANVQAGPLFLAAITHWLYRREKRRSRASDRSRDRL